MNYLIIGEDQRFTLLKTLLNKHGLVNTEPADLVIAGPSEMVTNYLDQIAVNAIIWGGKESKDRLAENHLLKLSASDYYRKKNSIATAEGTLSIAISETDSTINSLPVLILGYGFLGKEVASIFQNMGATVTVCSKDEGELAVAKFSSFHCILLQQLSILKYSLIINTIPAEVLTKNQLQTTPEDCILIDLASVPCCDKTNTTNLRIIYANGLPGRFSPFYAAKCIYEELLPFIGKEI